MSLPWQYLLIFLGVVIEGPGVTLTAALLASAGFLDPLVVFLCAAAGNLTGDLGWYLLGYFGRFETLLRRFPQLAWLELKIDPLKAVVAQNAARMLLTAKLAFGVASIPTLVAAGIARVPWQRVVLIQLLGEVIWSGALVLFGIFGGQYVARLQKDLPMAALVSAVILGLLLIWVIHSRLKNRSQRLSPQPANFVEAKIITLLTTGVGLQSRLDGTREKVDNSQRTNG